MGYEMLLLNVPPPTQTGLDWDGTAPGRRMLYWSSPLSMYPATYLFKVYQRNQVTRSPNNRYYTTFFWGNNGEFDWGAEYGQSYYGAQPYPSPANSNDGKWEISVIANDFITRDDGSSPYVTNNAWYSQAFVAENAGGSTRHHKFYIALPSVSTANTITADHFGGDDVPPSPALMFGQAPDDGAGLSWGHYPGWEEQNAIIRGIQVYSSVLTEAQIVDLSAMETDAEVLAYCSSESITSLWLLLMNPTPTDVTDKSGNARHGSWAGSERPTLWTA
jgi:hypothetical protein